MKVKIIRGNCWYKDSIGEIFEVTEHEPCHRDALWKVVKPSSWVATGIFKQDCEEVKEMSKFNIGDTVKITQERHSKRGSVGEITSTTEYRDHPWRVSFNGVPGDVFGETEMEIVEPQWMSKEAALKLCIDGAKVVNEFHKGVWYIYWDGTEFLSTNGYTSQSAAYVLDDADEKSWKLWTPPTPPKPKFAVDELCLDQDLFYAVVVSMEYDGKQWEYTVSNSTKDNGEEFYEYLSESEMTKV